jgi:hypothetical protein
MDEEDPVIQSWEAQLRSGSTFGDDDQFNDFMMPELKQPEPGFATTQTTPGSVHAHQQLTSSTYSPPEQKALIPATPMRRLVFDRKDKKAFLQNVKVVTEKLDTCTYDHLLKQDPGLAHAVLQFRNIKPSDTIAVERTGGKENLHFNTVTFSAYLLKICQTNLKESKRNAKKDNQDTM